MCLTQIGQLTSTGDNIDNPNSDDNQLIDNQVDNLFNEDNNEDNDIDDNNNNQVIFDAPTQRQEEIKRTLPKPQAFIDILDGGGDEENTPNDGVVLVPTTTTTTTVGLLTSPSQAINHNQQHPRQLDSNFEFDDGLMEDGILRGDEDFDDGISDGVKDDDVGIIDPINEEDTIFRPLEDNVGTNVLKNDDEENGGNAAEDLTDDDDELKDESDGGKNLLKSLGLLPLRRRTLLSSINGIVQKDEHRSQRVQLGQKAIKESRQGDEFYLRNENTTRQRVEEEKGGTQSFLSTSQLQRRHSDTKVTSILSTTGKLKTTEVGEKIYTSRSGKDNVRLPREEGSQSNSLLRRTGNGNRYLEGGVEETVKHRTNGNTKHDTTTAHPDPKGLYASGSSLSSGYQRYRVRRQTAGSKEPGGTGHKG